MSNFKHRFEKHAHRLCHYSIKQIFMMFHALLMLVCSMVHADGYQIGVFYFPGWKDKQVSAPSPLPWSPIKDFPEREPLLGWYDRALTM